MNRFHRFVADLGRSLGRVLASHPVEMGLAAAGYLLWILRMQWIDRDPEPFADERAVGVALLPIFFLAALLLNRLAVRGGGFRWLYRLSWLPLAGLVWIDGMTEWIAGSGYVITLLVLAPLALLMGPGSGDNRGFVIGTLNYLRAAMLGLLLGGVTIGLFAAIYYSVVYIFGLDGPTANTVARYATTALACLGIPAFLLASYDYGRSAEWQTGRTDRLLIDGLFTPALLIYTVILYLYVAKILLTWSLPRGGVAYLVFGFLVTACIVQALRPLLSGERRFERFFGRFSAIALVPLGLFWIGTGRRIAEYGLTEWRIYLLLCGAIVTLYVVLFLRPHTARYRWIAAAAFVLFAGVTFLPGLTAEELGLRAQSRRAERLARSTGTLTPEGGLRIAPFDPADTLHAAQLHALVASLEYLERDSAAMARFSLRRTDDLLDPLSIAQRSAIRNYDDTAVVIAEERIYLFFAASERRTVRELSYSTFYPTFEYGRMSEVPAYALEADTLHVRFDDLRRIALPTDALLQNICRAGGYDEGHYPDAEGFHDAASRWPGYRTDEYMLIFNDISIEFTPDGRPHITDVTLQSAFLR